MHNSNKRSLLKLCMSDYGMESALTREVQPCSANADLIPNQNPIQLGMYSSVGDKEES